MITEECVRQKILSIPYKEILNLFFLEDNVIQKIELPPDTKIIFVTQVPDRRVFDFYLESSEFPPVPMYGDIPRLDYEREMIKRFRIVEE